MARCLRQALGPLGGPAAEVWRLPELLGCVAPFLDPNEAAWSFIHVNKAAAAAAYCDNGQPVSRSVSLSWVVDSGLLTTLAGRIHARAMCYRLTRRQRVDFLCRCAAAGCSLESLEGAVVAAGLSPPPTDMLVAAAAAGRLATCRWLVEGVGCPGLHQLACLCLISAAGPGPGVVEEARAWLAPADLEGWSAEQEAEAVRGDLAAVKGFLFDSQAEEEEEMAKDPCLLWQSALGSLQARRDLDQSPDVWPPWAVCTEEFYCGPHAPLAVARLAQQIESDPEFSIVDCPALYAAAKAGHTEAVRFLLSRGAQPDADLPDMEAEAASRNGHVGVLQALHEAGCLGDPARCFQEGLEAGSLPVVEWLAGTFGIAALSEHGLLLYHAARSGSVQLLMALPGLLSSAFPGWDMFPGFCSEDAASSGCEEAVEWVVGEAGVPDEHHNGLYFAASHGDLRMVQRLRKLGCPYSAGDAEALAEAASRVPASAAALPWLEEPSCPASWEAAAAEARAAVEAKDRERARAEAERAQAQAKFKALMEAHAQARAQAQAQAQAQAAAAQAIPATAYGLQAAPFPPIDSQEADPFEDVDIDAIIAAHSRVAQPQESEDLTYDEIDAAVTRAEALYGAQAAGRPHGAQAGPSVAALAGQPHGALAGPSQAAQAGQQRPCYEEQPRRSDDEDEGAEVLGANCGRRRRRIQGV
ncbi:hypothetical protein HYH03_007538 [Edaphochlamys debaryana]|uniref:Uncharacterized protein n=1 Tax=Edaphochlamys debaryana TaxID=47281 RepID=A0A835Y860_9CHLO|nr:hypothetical protein HYH03_007538 [Edaphochlamys debaryana]|eukprot:KAG2494180.1 hypothetical protein HYH03_007538 [Edaphochlamys debaryana]